MTTELLLSDPCIWTASAWYSSVTVFWGWICFGFLLWAVALGLGVAKNRCCPVVAWARGLRSILCMSTSQQTVKAGGEKKSGALLSSSEKAGQIRLELTGRDIQLDWACHSRASIRNCTCPSPASLRFWSPKQGPCLLHLIWFHLHTLLFTVFFEDTFTLMWMIFWMIFYYCK